MTTHVVLWLWDGWRPIYAAEHVNAMHRMLAAYLPGCRVLCVTDAACGIECETFPVWKEPAFIPHSRPNCFRRLRIFDPAQQTKLGITKNDTVISLDLDTVIYADLRETLALWPASTFVATQGLFSKYNGALWRLTAGAHADVWHDFDYQTTPLLLKKLRLTGGAQIGSDQAWLSHKIANAPCWNTTHGLRFFTRHHAEHGGRDGLLWNFAGSVKPWHDAIRFAAPALYNQYRRFL